MTITLDHNSQTILLSAWQDCVTQLRQSKTEQEFNIWIRPIETAEEAGTLVLYVPNAFFAGWVNKNYLSEIKTLVAHHTKADVVVKVGTHDAAGSAPEVDTGATSAQASKHVAPQKSAPSASTTQGSASEPQKAPYFKHKPSLNIKFGFDNFVEGKSNQLALAASKQVAQNPGDAYNPLFLYGGVGLGKTHLMHAIGNLIVAEKKNAKVVYLHSERFVADMVRALQNNRINEFKHYYRSVDALLIDDIQFFAGKDRSQEEFFHTFNSLLEGHQQVIMTCDRYPKEINGLEERLKSRFGWGLTVAIEPPELETRVAILINKASDCGVELKHEVAFFIAKRIRSNVRELEGALKRVVANANFTGQDITIDFVKEALKDLITLQDKLVTLDNIKKTVAEYFNIKVADLLSKSRSRSVARPRQIAMSLSKELTNHSLPEIGDAFGGRDHTTVIHATRTIANLRDRGGDVSEDYANLLRILTT